MFCIQYDLRWRPKSAPYAEELELKIPASKLQRGRPTVVIVGGGYGGTALAKALDETTDVVLVEPRDAFMHNIAALRALVDPSWLPNIYLPYDRLLDAGRVVRDRAALVEPKRVVTASDEEIVADYRAGDWVELCLPGEDRPGRHRGRS
jgi:NADPH-dependent 2,4-dienoyl-CoA reductase/sulfur reductase-like enzyme